MQFLGQMEETAATEGQMAHLAGMQVMSQVAQELHPGDGTELDATPRPE